MLGEIQQKQDEGDAAKKQTNAQIEELEAEMHWLSLEVRDGGTYRDVPCEPAVPSTQLTPAPAE